MGQLHTLTYSDGTPSATLDYDRAGRLDSVVDAAGTHSVSWTDRDQMENENYTAGLLSGVSVNRVYDSQFRLSRIELAQSGVTQTRERFVYDPISWLDYAVEENADGSVELRRYDYTFQAGTPFVGSVAYFEASSPLMTQNYSHDSLGRLSGASAVLAGGPTAYGVNYQFDPNYDRRTEADLADGTKWNFGYNNRSEVTSGKRQLASGAKAGGEQFEYTFDDIGNRIQTKAGGDAAGNNLRSASYTANALNQISQRGVPESLWLVGDAPSALTLLGAVSGSAGVPPAQAFTIQRQENGRFFGEAPVDNSSDPVYARMTIAGKNGSTLADFHTGYKFTPKTPENFTYDDDGNLTGDGQWTYTWDAENQLTRMVSATQVGPPMRIDFKYDWMGRRISKTVWNNTGGTGTPALDERFVYDGWNLIAILNSQSAILDSFIWGLDLSGTMQGAGGVGGLLSMTVHSGPQAGTYYYGYNGNGNVMGLVKANGIIAAQYEYGPFGEVIRSTGPMAKANPFRFSTKYQDDESELLYYGRRYYTPSTGTWLSRDNIEERGGVNLYGFVLNNPVLRFDIHGLSVDPNSIVGPDIAVGISRVGPTFVNSLLMNNARNPLFPYETVRKNGTPLALLANFAFNNPGFRGNGVNRFVFTCKCGWIDSGHFWSSALGGHGLGSDTAFLLGVFVEEVQGIKIKGFEGWSNSSYTAEDLPSDLLGSLFGQSLRGKDYALIPRLFEQLLKDCGAVDPAKLSPEQWKLLRQEAIGWERDLVRNHDAYPKRAKACTALCPGTKQSQDDDFTRILQNLSR